MDLIDELAEQLKKIDFQGYICLAGHGEPTLHPEIFNIVEKLGVFNVVLVSNGIPLTKKDVEKLSKNCQLKISVHDWNNRRRYFEKFENTNAIFRNHDMKNPQMNLYNRAGSVNTKETPEAVVCNYPFYKIMIDIDGSYRICEADWIGRTRTPYTIYDVSIEEYFTNRLESVRR